MNSYGLACYHIGNNALCGLDAKCFSVPESSGQVLKSVLPCSSIEMMRGMISMPYSMKLYSQARFTPTFTQPAAARVLFVGIFIFVELLSV